MVRPSRSVPEETTISALIALNSWVRSEVARALCVGRLRRVVYLYKYHALRALADGGIDLSPVPVYVESQCRDCDGSERNHCWRCDNSGSVRLEFVQVRLPGGQIWHSPREPLKCPLQLLDTVDGIEAILSKDWNVGKEGAAMDYQDLAAALNVAEAWYGVPGWYTIRWWDNDPAYYKLPLGDRPSTCAFCDGPVAPGAMRYSAATLLLQWHDWCCASCSKQFGTTFPEFPVPLELISEPVALWLQRRENWERQQVNRLPVFSEKEPMFDRGKQLGFDLGKIPF